MLMKKILLTGCLCIVLIIQARSQPRADEQLVQQTVIKLFDALSNRDSVSLKLYCTPDIVLFENGATWNLDTIILKAIKFNTASDFKRINTIDFIQTALNSNTAWTTYNNKAEITSNGKKYLIQWLETVVLIKQEKSWKIKLLHSTLIKRN
jgi:ketosteroid isomerase-like protein